MKFILTDNRGQRIGQPMTDRKAIRQVARSHVRAGNAVMIFFADDAGNMLGYSSADTAAAHAKRAIAKATGEQPPE